MILFVDLFAKKQKIERSFTWLFFFFRLLVGAPRARGDEPGVDYSGAVYQCPLNTHTRDCTPLDTKSPGSRGMIWLFLVWCL